MRTRFASLPMSLAAPSSILLALPLFAGLFARVFSRLFGRLFASLFTPLLLGALLAGCAAPGGSAPPTLHEVRAFAAESAKLTTFAELTTRYRDTYKREQPYLSPTAERREQELDSRRRAAYSDLIAIEKSMVLYMQTLGKLAGSDEYDLSDRVRKLGSTIKAWPDSGLDARHVSAYTALGRIIAGALTATYQHGAVEAMLREADEPVQNLLDAMTILLRTYDKTNANEKKIVLGLFEVEIPFIDTPRERLLSALAKAHYQSKSVEYGLLERRYGLAEKNLQSIRRGHQKLIEQIGQIERPGVAAVLQQSVSAVRDSRIELETLIN